MLGKDPAGVTMTYTNDLPDSWDEPTPPLGTEMRPICGVCEAHGVPVGWSYMSERWSCFRCLRHQGSGPALPTNGSGEDDEGAGHA